MEVVIESENVTQIGDNAFYNCPKLSKITFVNTIEKIGFYAFAGCDFKEIELPYNLKILGNGVFSDNENLSKITYYNLNEIGDNAFSNTALSEIRIPYTLSYFGFQGKMSSLTKFTIDARNTIFEYSNGCLINKETNSLVKCISSSVSIPKNIVELYPYSLSYLDFSDIAKVVIPESAKYVGFRAFYNTKLSDIDLGKIEEIDENSLSNIIFVDSDSISIVLPETLKQIEYHAFQNLVCNEVVIPISVTKVGSAIFEDCKVASIKIHSTTTKLDDCDDNWDYGIDDTITTIYIIDD